MDIHVCIYIYIYVQGLKPADRGKKLTTDYSIVYSFILCDYSMLTYIMLCSAMLYHITDTRSYHIRYYNDTNGHDTNDHMLYYTPSPPIKSFPIKSP